MVGLPIHRQQHALEIRHGELLTAETGGEGFGRGHLAGEKAQEELARLAAIGGAELEPVVAALRKSGPGVPMVWLGGERARA